MDTQVSSGPRSVNIVVDIIYKYHIYCVRAVNAVMRLSISANTSDPSLLAYVISTNIS